MIARLPLGGLVVLSLYIISTVCASAPPPQENPRQDFRELLTKIASFSPDPCDRGPVQDSSDIESSAFGRAADIVTESLNATHVSPESAVQTATETLTSLQRMSAEINAAWPEENRFGFEVLKLPPVFVVRMGLRTHETFFVFGKPEGYAGSTGQVWGSFSSIEGATEHRALRSYVGLYPLHRGPSQHPRFLATFGYVGCAGSSGIAYNAHEWEPEAGNLDLIIKQSGALGLDDKVPGFEQIGKLNTEGPSITLPYCWFSPIDTWDNPSLCTVDTYDLSGDDVSFVSHKYNRPDLVPVAKALEYAEQRDYPAVLAYCSSSDIARRLVSEIPPDFFADQLTMTQNGTGRETVELGFEPKFRLDVELRSGRWQVVAFSTQ